MQDIDEKGAEMWIGIIPKQMSTSGGQDFIMEKPSVVSYQIM